MILQLEELRKGDTITFKPHQAGDKFPDFSKVEVESDGYLRGWVLVGEISKTEVVTFGRFGPVELVSKSSKEVTVKKIRGV